MKKKRSIGITILGFSLLLPVISILLQFLPRVLLYCQFRRINFTADFLVILTSVPFIVASIGILKLKNWARIFCIYWVALIGLYFCYLCLSVGYLSLRSILEALVVSVIPAIVIIFYLTRPKVKEQFKIG